MDPDACLRRIGEAIRDDDREDLVAALEDLATWIRRGGFMPRADWIVLDWAKRS